MAARLNRLDTERVLSRIRYSQLLNRLQNNALGKLKQPDANGKYSPYKLTDGERQSIVWLLERKLARAEAPKQLEVSGQILLAALIRGDAQALQSVGNAVIDAPQQVAAIEHEQDVG